MEHRMHSSLWACHRLAASPLGPRYVDRHCLRKLLRHSESGGWACDVVDPGPKGHTDCSRNQDSKNVQNRWGKMGKAGGCGSESSEHGLNTSIEKICLNIYKEIWPHYMIHRLIYGHIYYQVKLDCSYHWVGLWLKVYRKLWSSQSKTRGRGFPADCLVDQFYPILTNMFFFYHT